MLWGGTTPGAFGGRYSKRPYLCGMVGDPQGIRFFVRASSSESLAPAPNVNARVHFLDYKTVFWNGLLISLTNPILVLCLLRSSSAWSRCWPGIDCIARRSTPLRRSARSTGAFEFSTLAPSGPRRSAPRSRQCGFAVALVWPEEACVLGFCVPAFIALPFLIQDQDLRSQTQTILAGRTQLTHET